jgi:hypothetical protein
MTLTEAEQLSIVTILGILPSLLDAQITKLGADLDADREVAIRTELARWTTLGGKFVRLTATESNMGVNTDSRDAKADVQRNLALLLELPWYSYGMHIGTIQIGL